MNHVVHLSEYGFLGISGRDSIKFFQGYTTCELNNLDHHQSGIGATCNLKGRMLASYRVIYGADGLIIRMDRRLVEPMIDFLKKYIVFSKATLENLSDRYTCYGYILNDSSPTAPITCPPGVDLWQASVLGPVICVNDSPSETDVEGTHAEVRSNQDPGNSLQRCELWLDSTADQSIERPASNAAADLWHHEEIAQGLAWVTAETTEEYIPQMLNYDKINAISFEKGCYLGQEIVARMQYRGALKKKLLRGTPSTLDPVAWKTGDSILNSKGRSVGNIVSTSQNSMLAVVQVVQIKNKDTEENQKDADESGPVTMTLQLATGDKVNLDEVG